MTAWPSPTARAPTGRSRNTAPSVATALCAPDGAVAAASIAAAAAMPLSALERRGLINQHDRDFVANRVSQSARRTHEARRIGLVLELAFALRAHQDRKELRREGHETRSSDW